MAEISAQQQLLKETQENSKALNPTVLLERHFCSTAQNPDVESPQNCIESASQASQDRVEHGVIRVMQWNLLAQGLCQGSDGFILCPPAALKWNHRQNHILEELVTYSPDIYCLQELDHFFFVSQKLNTLGFSGLFCPKPDSPCLYEADNNGPDGCAIFWRDSHFKLLHHDKVVLQDDSGFKTNQVALICKLQIVAGPMKDREFTVAATHLKSKHGYEELRFQQGKSLEKTVFEKAGNTPVVIGGDFNAEPQEKVIQMMKSSQLGLSSAYTQLSPEGREPDYTTWKVRGKKGRGQEEICHTIDYLFFTGKDFVCQQLLLFPTAQEMGEGFLPSFSYPSDHLSLVADLKLL